jgi:hypothetical protein
MDSAADEVDIDHIPNSWMVYLYDIEVYIQGFHIPKPKLKVTYHIVYPMEGGFGEYTVEAWLETANDGRFELHKMHNIDEATDIHNSVEPYTYVYYSVHNTLGRYHSTR